MPLVKVYSSRRFYCQTGILSISLRNSDCETVAECLAKRVSVRAGLTASLAHRSACTLKTGTLRISPSCFTKLKDASILLRALRSVYTKSNIICSRTTSVAKERNYIKAIHNVMHYMIKCMYLSNRDVVDGLDCGLIDSLNYAWLVIGEI